MIADVFELILKYQFGVIIDDYCKYETKPKLRKWDSGKLKNSEILKILNNSSKKVEVVYSYQLNNLIKHYAKNNLKLISLADDLRNVEIKIRNKTAHEIISVTDDFIKKETGFTSEQIMDKIRKILGFAGINIKNEYWNSYDNMNSIIIDAI